MFDPRAGYPSVVSYVRYRDPAAAIAWLSSVSGGREAIRMTLPDGKVGRAELVVGSHVISVGLAPTDSGGRTPGDRSSVRAMTLVFVADVKVSLKFYQQIPGAVLEISTNDLDALHTQVSEAGMEPDGPPDDRHWGERALFVTDPDGNDIEFAAG